LPVQPYLFTAGMFTCRKAAVIQRRQQDRFLDLESVFNRQKDKGAVGLDPFGPVEQAVKKGQLVTEANGIFGQDSAIAHG